jgi:hypothetical protein
VRLFRAVGCADIKEIDNGKTLAELKFKRNEVITGYRKSMISSVVVPLLNIDGTDLSDRAIHIFTEWFLNCADVQVDPSDPNSERKMSNVGCQYFIKTATDEDITLLDAQIANIMEAYDYDKDGLMDLGGFLNFWRDSVRNKEDIVRNNLLAYGYRSDLKRSPADGVEDDCFQIRPNKESMPRFKISSEKA